MPQPYKTFYFIRHAQSEGNVGSFFQTMSTPLTETGVLQSQLLAQRIVGYGIEKVLCSTMTRAVDTIQPFVAQFGVPIVLSDLLIERRRPTLHTPVPDSANMNTWLRIWIDENLQNPDIVYTDGESIKDLIGRSRQVMDMMVSLPEDTVAVVTHGMFFRVLWACMYMGQLVEITDCVRAINTIFTPNAGITEIRYCPESTSGQPWKIRRLGDTAHLELLEKKEK